MEQIDRLYRSNPRWTFAHVLLDQRRWVRENLPSGFFEFLCSVNPSPSSHKLIARRFFEEAGLRIAKLYACGLRLEQAMDVVSKIGRCFVKPEYGGSAHGTIGLVKRGTKYLNTLSGEKKSLDEWKAHLEGSHKRYRCKRWLVEELLTKRGTDTSPPDEYKFYTFSGRVVLIKGRRPVWKNKASCYYRYFDVAWNPVWSGAYTDSIDDSIPPLEGQERQNFTDAVVRMSRRRPLPFTRIDLYGTQEGVFGGELTIVTGGSDQFISPWRDRLGEAWYETASAMSEAIRDGELDDVISFYQQVMRETRSLWLPAMWRRRWQKLPGFLKRRAARLIPEALRTSIQ